MLPISSISEIVASFGVLVLAGILISSYSFRFRMPDVLVLILAGMFFGGVKYHGVPLLSFPLFFLVFISIFSLCILFFDASSVFRWNTFHTFSWRSLFLVLSFTLLLLCVYSFFVRWILDVSWISSIMFSLMLAGTAPEFLLQIVGGAKSRIVQVLNFESLFSSFVVLIPVIILFFYAPSIVAINVFALSIISRIALSFGVGVLVALLSWKVLHFFSASRYSSSALLCSAILSYVLAELFGGVGILGVVALGIFFGNVYFKEDFSILGFPSVFGKFLYIILFGLTGIITPISFTLEFLGISLLLFFAHILVRLVAVFMVRGSFHFSLGEIFFVACTAPKGGAVATVIFTLAVFSNSGVVIIPGIGIILPFAVALFAYSLLFSMISVVLSKKIFGVDVKEKE